jgi:hypothetical protein
MRRFLPASANRPLLDEAALFLQQHTSSGEVLVLSATRESADDLVRLHSGNLAGVHRVTISGLTALLTANAMAERGLAPVNSLGAEALAARAIHRLRSGSALQYFAPVAASPGFARALARTLRELRLEDVSQEALALAGPAGLDLAALHAAYKELLAESRLVDFPALLSLAAQTREHRLIGLPLLLFDVP